MSSSEFLMYHTSQWTYLHFKNALKECFSALNTQLSWQRASLWSSLGPQLFWASGGVPPPPASPVQAFLYTYLILTFLAHHLQRFALSGFHLAVVSSHCDHPHITSIWPLLLPIALPARCWPPRPHPNLSTQHVPRQPQPLLTGLRKISLIKGPKGGMLSLKQVPDFGQGRGSSSHTMGVPIPALSIGQQARVRCDLTRWTFTEDQFAVNSKFEPRRSIYHYIKNGCIRVCFGLNLHFPDIQAFEALWLYEFYRNRSVINVSEYQYKRINWKLI